MKQLIGLIVCCSLFSGCVAHRLDVTSLTYSPETMELVGPVSGQFRHGMPLCIPISPFLNSLTAITEALKMKNTDATPRLKDFDAILNPAVDTRMFYLPPFYCEKQITVYGIAVKFKK